MKKKAKAARPTMLMTFDLVEITDPAEQAALDERCRKADEHLAAAAANAGKANTVRKRPRNGAIPPKT